MKKKMFIAVGLVCLAFIAGGAYIVTTIETATSELDQLIMLHRVEILREHLLIQIKNAQSDFYLMGTRYERPPKKMLANIKKMESVSITCFDCHHTTSVVRKLKNLNTDIDFYKNSINKILRIRGNRALMVQESDTAYRTAEKIMNTVDAMVHMASSRLASRTESSLKNISRSKSILYALVLITPFVAAALCFGFIREFTKPVNGLLTATRKLKSGDLDYRIAGLKDEFGEVATSFNEMSESLKQNMLKIQESENRYRTLFESAGDAIFIVEAEGDRRGNIVDANRAAAEMHGYSVDELLQLNLIKDLDVPEAAQKAPERIRRILSGEWIKAEIDHRKKDGTVFPIEIINMSWPSIAIFRSAKKWRPLSCCPSSNGRIPSTPSPT
jgi:two-component system sensor histidine kinase AtoS